MFVKCDNYSYDVKYVKVGTIAYARLKEDGSIRMAKCIGCEFIPSEKKNSYNCCLIPLYSWKIAGLKGTFYGSHTSLRNPNDTRLDYNYMDGYGIIYNSEFDAQHKLKVLEYNAEFSIKEAFISKYGISEKNIYKTGTWDNCFQLKSYWVKEDGAVDYGLEHYSIKITENGVDVFVPNFDNKKTFTTFEAAVYSYKPKKVYTFDDEEVEEKPKTPKKVKVTIVIPQDKMAELDKIGASVVSKSQAK